MQLLAFLLVLAQQDATYPFTLEQGVAADAWHDPDLLTTTQEQLLAGLEKPALKGDAADGNSPSKRNRPLPQIDHVRGAGSLKVQGSITIKSDGTWQLDLTRVEASWGTRRWWVDIGEPTTSSNLVDDKWKGTRDEWDRQVAAYERELLARYAKLLTPANLRPTAKAATSKEMPELLYAVMSLEQDLALVALCRMDRKTLKEAPAELAKAYPAHVLAAASLIVQRLRAQAGGELAPVPARTKSDRKIANAEWKKEYVAIPIMSWGDDTVWATQFKARWKRFRAQLTESINASKKQPMTRTN